MEERIKADYKTTCSQGRNVRITFTIDSYKKKEWLDSLTRYSKRGEEKENGGK